MHFLALVLLPGNSCFAGSYGFDHVVTGYSFAGGAYDHDVFVQDFVESFVLTGGESLLEVDVGLADLFDQLGGVWAAAAYAAVVAREATSILRAVFLIFCLGDTLWLSRSGVYAHWAVRTTCPTQRIQRDFLDDQHSWRSLCR